MDVWTRTASAARTARSTMCGRVYACDTLLERLAPDLQDMAAALGPCIQEERAMVGQRHLTRPRHVPPTDQPDIGDGVMRGAKRARGDDRGLRAGEAGDAMNARGLQRFGETHRWQNGGQPPRQHRFPDPRWAEEQQVVIRIAVPLSTLSPLQAGVDGCCDHKQDVTSRTGSSLQVHGIAGGRQST
jgi:hypothetical protein